MGLSGRLLLAGCGSRRRGLLHSSIASSSRRSGLSCGFLLVVGFFPTLQSLEVDLGNGLVEGLALGGSDLQLLLGGLAGAVTVLRSVSVIVLVDAYVVSNGKLTEKVPAPQALPPRTSSRPVMRPKL